MLVSKVVSELSTEAVDHRNYRLMKNSTRYDKDLANNLSKVTKKTTVQMKVRTFSENLG